MIMERTNCFWRCDLSLDMSWDRESNPEPAVYDTAARPVELSQQNKIAHRPHRLTAQRLTGAVPTELYRLYQNSI